MKNAAVVFGCVCAFIGVVVVLLVAFYYGGIIGNHVSANYNKAVVMSKIKQHINTADFAQDTYEQFFNECNAIIAENQQIVIAENRIKSLKAEPDDQFGQKANKIADAEADLAGIQSLQASNAANYNAQAEEWTRNAFKDAALPARIEPPYSNLTTCS